MNIILNKTFTRSGGAHEDDVRAMKRALNWLGYYMPYAKIGLSNTPDGDVFASLRAFQAAQNLPETEAARPDDETVRALNTALKKRLSGAVSHE